MKLIFLDFDGVLHPNFCQEEHYFSRIGYLMAALDGFKDDVEVIISSSWRFHWPADVLRSNGSGDRFLPECRSRICSTACRLMAGQGNEPPAMEVDSLREHALFASSSATA